VVASDSKEEHPKTGEQLAETAEEESDIGKGATELLMIGVFVNTNANLLQTKTDYRYEQTKYTNGFRGL